MPTSIDLDSSFSIPPQVMSRLVEDETVILDLSSGMYFGLDGVGKHIWESIGDGKNVGEIASVIVDKYSVDKARAETDVVDFIGELLERGLLAER